MNKKITLGLISLLLIVGPWGSVMFASKVAAANNCQLNASQVYPCQVAGQDIGGILYYMGMMGWVGILTLIPGVAGLVMAIDLKSQPDKIER
jgi:hypothetical protein